MVIKSKKKCGEFLFLSLLLFFFGNPEPSQSFFWDRETGQVTADSEGEGDNGRVASIEATTLPPFFMIFEWPERWGPPHLFVEVEQGLVWTWRSSVYPGRYLCITFKCLRDTHPAHSRFVVHFAEMQVAREPCYVIAKITSVATTPYKLFCSMTLRVCVYSSWGIQGIPLNSK